MKPASFKVRQSAFEGIIVSKENLNFSDSEKSILTLVSSTSAYSVEIKENPGNIFSFTTDESGVTFTVNRSQNRQNHSGRASIIPENPDIAPIYINLNLPKKDDYHYLSGIWTVAQNTDASGDKSDFVFTPAIPLASFNVTVQKAPLTDYPLTAEYIQGKVRIGIQGIGIDKATDTYYNIHFNGGTSDNPNGTYIFSTPGSAAWDAVPEFLVRQGKIFQLPDKNRLIRATGSYKKIHRIIPEYEKYNCSTAAVRDICVICKCPDAHCNRNGTGY